MKTTDPYSMYVCSALENMINNYRFTVFLLQHTDVSLKVLCYVYKGNNKSVITE